MGSLSLLQGIFPVQEDLDQTFPDLDRTQISQIALGEQTKKKPSGLGWTQNVLHEAQGNHFKVALKQK